MPNDLVRLESGEPEKGDFGQLPKYLKDIHSDIRLDGFDQHLGEKQVPLLNLDEISLLEDFRHRNVNLLTRRHVLTELLAAHGKCYPPLILQRAKTYEALEYADLAASDANVVYMLCQKALSEEWVIDLEAFDLDGQPWEPGHSTVLEVLVDTIALLCRCLTDLGATKDAEEKKVELIGRYAELHPEEKSETLLADIHRHLLQPRGLLWSCKDCRSQGRDTNGGRLSSFGLSRREVYPWNTYEPDRNSPSSVADINGHWKHIAPHLQARVTKLPALDGSGDDDAVWSQLGLFAAQDLTAGEEILNEQSILTAIRPLADAICDACGVDLEIIPIEERVECSGIDCDITFCSEECAERAKTEYHQPWGENQDDESEQDNTETQQVVSSSRAIFCGNSSVHNIGRHETTETPEWDLYFLLLARTIAMSITQDIHPLDLPEIKYLWGHFNNIPCPPSSTARSNLLTPSKTLPFSSTHTLSLPLDFFTTLSDSIADTTTNTNSTDDILSTTSQLLSDLTTPYTALWLHHFDPWIQQTLYAKFRGVANATQSTFDGRPEIASVHPLWSLANHSCAPNVKWTPTGTRVFTVRTREERWSVGVQDQQREEEGNDEQQTKEQEKEEGGSDSVKIKAGSEILSHYTDPRLGLAERRERLRQVLGGDCRCERCLYEEQNGQKMEGPV